MPDNKNEAVKSDYGWRDQFKPIIFIPDEGKDTLKEVFLERHAHCDIYWYKWPHDGKLFFMIEDYEPVVIIYQNKQVYCVMTRPHWNYKPYAVDDGLVVPPEILFKTDSHDAYAKTSEAADIFERDKKGHLRKPYNPVIEKSELIPTKYRTGLGHPSNYKLRPGKDPVVRAKEIFDEYCT